MVGAVVCGVQGYNDPPCTPASITLNPTNQTCSQGATVTFTVGASGTAPLRYQWQEETNNQWNNLSDGVTSWGSTISGSATWQLTISNINANDAAPYMVIVNNDCGSATSWSATLIVNVNATPPVITQQPTNQTVIQGSNAAFSVTATGTAPLSYQWWFNGTNILSGATNASLTLTNVQSATNAGNYSVVVSNLVDSVVSSNALLTVISICITPPSGLVGWWAAEYSALDSAGTNNGTTPFGIAYATGKVGHAFDFDGSSRRVSVPDSPDFKLTNSLTIEGWIFPRQQNSGCIFSRADNRLGVDCWILSMSPTNSISFQIMNGSNQVATIQAPIRTNQWSYIAATLEGTNGALKLYTNGVLAAQTNTTVRPRANLDPAQEPALGIGNHGGNYAQSPFNGLIDEISLFSRALSQSEIQSIYGAGSGKCPLPPSIKIQPVSQSVNRGNNTTFGVTAAGTAPLSYQWYFNGTNLVSGATQAFLILTNVQSASAGNYSVVVSNIAGSVSSSNAVLTVNLPPLITTQPQSLTVFPGSNATFSVTATGAMPLAYQWRFNGTNISGATDSNYTRSNVQLPNAGAYSVVVSNIEGVAISASAQLTVVTAPSITTQPAGQTVVQGANALFEVTVTGTDPLSYQWRFNDAPIGGATASYYIVANAQSTNAGNYSVVITNAAGSATSSNALLTVNIPPSITVQPQSQTVIPGTNVTFSVVATGTASLGYQWRFNGTNLAGATGTNYTKNNVQPADAGYYSVVVTNMAGSVTSLSASLTVAAPPAITVPPASQTVVQGTNVTFWVSATGTVPLSYQWRFNGTNLAGATGTNYTKNNVQPADAGNYSVVVSNAGGSVASADALLTVLVPPVITSGPASQTVAQGSNVTFSVSATGTPPLSYQWKFNGANIAGATTNSYTTNNVQLANAGTYSVVVTNAAGNAASVNAVLTVVAISGIVVDGASPVVPQSNAVCMGSQVILRATPNPAGAAFPGGYPVWVVIPPSGAASTNAGSLTTTITTTQVGSYGVQAACGTASTNFTLLSVDSADSDYDGVSGCQEILDGTDPNNPEDVPSIQLGAWLFDTTDWSGLQGQVPMTFTNLMSVRGVYGNAVRINTNVEAWLVYHETEPGSPVANFNCRRGSVSFWFQPDWNSGDSYGTTGPTNDARLIEWGTKGTADGCWGLYLGPGGTNLYFCTQTNSGAVITNLQAAIKWNSNYWHYIALTYGPTNSRLYLDGQCVVTNGCGITNWPSYSVRTNGFCIGGDHAGRHHARGRFDNLHTCNYVRPEQDMLIEYGTTCFSGMDIVLVIDKSGSMTNPISKLNGAKQAATNFVNTLNFQNDRAGVIAFSGYTSPSAPDTRILQHLTNNNQAVLLGISQIDTSGGWTWMSNAIATAHMELYSNHMAGNLPVLVLLTDGQPQTGYNPERDTTNYTAIAANWAKTNGTRIVAIGLGTDAATNFLKYTVATATNLYYYAPDPTNLVQIYNTLAHSLCRTNMAPSVAITNLVDYQVFNAPATIQIIAAASDPQNALVKVEFYSGTTDLGGDSYSPFSVTWGPVTNSGTYALTAVATNAYGLCTTSAVVHVIVNNPPQVSAGPNTNAIWPDGSGNVRLQLKGSASDPDGLPNGTLTTTWASLPGPGAVTFDSANLTNTWATFTNGGTYTLQLTASDGAASASSRCTVVIQRRPFAAITWPVSNMVFCAGTPIAITAYAADPDGTIAAVQFLNGTSFLGTGSPAGGNYYSLTWTGAPVGTSPLRAVAIDNDGLSYTSAPVNITVPAAVQVNPGAGQTVLLTNASVTVVLNGTITGGVGATCVWTRVSGPASEQWTNATSANATVTFTEPGGYVLRLFASDDCSWDSGVVSISVVRNQPPVVDAGPDLTITPNSTANLNGSVKDDGLLLPVSNWWQVVSQPAGANAKFSNSNLVVTTATNLAIPGVYTLSLSAYDGLVTSSNMMRVYVVPAGSRTWTFDADFEEGTLLNVNYDDFPDQLQLNKTIEPFPYVWMACSGRGTIVRIDVNSGQVLGEYRTTPETIDDYGDHGQGTGPSRTTVDKNGNVWVGNRGDLKYYQDPNTGDWVTKGSVTRIGLVIGGTRGWIQTNETGTVTNFVIDPKGEYLQPPFKYCTAIDRNHDGYIHTSFGLTNLLHWDQSQSGTNDLGGVSSADDECIVNYTRVYSQSTRTVAVDTNNDVWVGGYGDRNFEKLDGTTGLPIPGTATNWGGGGYGGLVDGRGVLWSSGQDNALLLRYDPATGTATNLTTPGNYGLGIDPTTGEIWHTALYGGTVAKISPTGTVISNYFHGDPSANAQGVAVDAHSNVWVAHSLWGNSVGHLRTDGTFVGIVDLGCDAFNGNGPTGVAIDANGKVWVACLESSKAMRINPDKGPIGPGGVRIGAVDMVVELDNTNVINNYISDPFNTPYSTTTKATPPYANPYNYSDMTGFISVGETAPSGTWTVTYDSGVVNMPWGLIAWNALTNTDTRIKVEMRAATNDTALNDTNNLYLLVTNGVPLSGATGQIAQIRVTFGRNVGSSNTPVLYDLTLMPAGSTSAVTNQSVSLATSDSFGVFQNSTNNLLNVLANDVIAANPNTRIVSWSTPAYGYVFTNASTITTTNIYSVVHTYPPRTALFYTPNQDFTGKDRFTYTATDGQGGWGRAVVKVAVLKPAPALTTNDLPIPQPDSYIFDENSLTNFMSVMDNDANTLSIVGFSQPPNGLVQRAACGLLYTPNPGFTGTNTFTYTVASSAGGRATTNVTVVVNNVPVSRLQVFLGSHELHNGDTILISVSGTGISVTNTLTLTNSGTVDIQFGNNGWQIDPNNPGSPFSLDPPSPVSGSSDTLSANAAQNLNAIFAATAVGQTNAPFLIYTNDIYSNPALALQITFGALVTSTTPGPGIALLSPTTNQQFIGYSDISLVATNSSGTVPTNVVFVFQTPQGLFKIGEDATAPYAITWPSVPPGNYTLLAYAFDNANRVGVSAPVNITVNPSPSVPTNALPVANDYQISIPMLASGTTNYAINVLANDFDPNHDPLTVVNFTPHGQYGSLSQSGNTLYYAPYPMQSGDDVLLYTISDGHGGAATARIIVHISNIAPPTVRIIAPPSGTSIQLLIGLTTNIVFNVTTSPGVTNVTYYYDNGRLVGGSTNGPLYAVTWPTLAGNHTIIAVATDTNGLVGYSTPMYIEELGPGGDQPPTADIQNFAPVAQDARLQLDPQMPVIQEAITNLIGTATDPDNDPVTYQVLVYDQNGRVVGDFTPGPTNAYGFHIGAATGTLATLNLSGLQNGTYQVELNVRDPWYENSTRRSFMLDSNLKIGNFSFSVEDLTIPVNGIPLTVIRSYNSLHPEPGAFGPSWTMSLNDMNVTIDEDRQDVTDDDGDKVNLRVGGGYDVTLTLPDGRVATYGFSAPLDSLGNGTPVWTAPAFVQDNLLPLGDPQFTYFSEQGPYWKANGWPCFILEHFDFPGWELDTRDGTRYIIERQDLGQHDFTDALFLGGGNEGNPLDDPTVGNGTGSLGIQVYGKPRLARIIQRNGDRIEINDQGVQHYDATNHLTRAIYIERDTAGRVVTLRDPNSGSNGLPVVKYFYDDDSGKSNLFQVHKLTDRNANGGLGAYDVTIYEYTNSHFPHFITGIIDPRGLSVARNEYNENGQLTAVVDADGNRTEFSHDANNKMERVIDRLGHTNTYVYDLHGNVTAITNALNQVMTMAYDANNNKTNDVTYLNGQPYATNNYSYRSDNLLLATINPLGFSNVFTYGQHGRLETSTDARNNSTTNYYDNNTDNLTGTSDALGNTTSNSYSGGLLVGSRDAVGTVTTNYYDGSENLIATATYVGSTILSTNTFTYDADGNRLTFTVWRQVGGSWTGATATYIYDAMNRVVQIIDPDGGTNTVIYNVIGKQQATIDKLGRITSHDYDNHGRLWSTTYPDLTTETSAYDANGNCTNSVDRGGRTTTYSYDALNRLTNTIYADLTINTTVYDGVGQVAQTIDARGMITGFGYDAAGRRLAVTNAVGITDLQTVSSYGYDANGNQITFTDAMIHVTTNVFDSLNRQVQVQFPDGTKAGMGYDVAGRRVAGTNQDSIVTLFGYDGVGRLTAVTNAFLKVTRYQYDEAGNQTAQVDALNRTNTFAYDGMGRRIAHTMPTNSLVEWFSYDLAGNLIYDTNFNGVVITNQYDVMNRLTNRASVNGYKVSYTYNPATGQRQTMTDSSGTTSYSYDNRDRLQLKTVAWVGGPSVSLNYRYDANGNLTNLWSSTAGGVNLAYNYDPLSRLTNVLASGGAAASYGFDAVGNLQTKRYGNGVTNLYQYDSLNRLTNLTWKLTTASLANFSYQLGLTGNRTNLSETVNNTSRTNAWNYDALYRLTNENISALGILGYGYDPVGNRTNRTSAVTGISASSSSYNANDWLTTDQYDANGNTTNSVSVPYRYDVENRLVDYNNGAVTLAYNGDGIRMVKNVGGQVTYFLVDDRNPSGYAQVLEEITAYVGATNLTKVYAYGLDLISQRQPGVATNYYGYDGHGSVRFLLNLTGGITDTYVYDAYGTLITFSGNTDNNYLYCGEQYDPQLKFYYLRARYLNPDTGRFWTLDTTEGDNEDPLSLHKYLYCHDNPVNMTDPSGNVPILSNFFWGNKVHQKLYDNFIESGLGARRTYNQPMSSILGIPYVPILTAGRPDLVQYPEAGNPGEVYEIKPAGSFIEGQVQLQWYLTVLNRLDPQKRQWDAGSIETYSPPPFITLSGGVFAIVSPPVRGVILYEVEDLRVDSFLIGVYIGSQIEIDVGEAILVNTLAPVF